MKRYDLLIIGAGTAGLSAAREAAKYTENFAIVESGPAGTACARTACMPSHALIEAATAYHARRKLAEFGIEGGERLSANIPRILKRVRQLRDHFVQSSMQTLGEYNVIRGAARFAEPNAVVVDGKIYKARAIVVCTGSTPRIPPELAALKEQVLTTDSLFEQKNLPGRLAVVGLGSVGAELSQAIARLGVQTAGIHASSAIADTEDPEIQKTARDILGEDLALYTDTRVTRAERKDAGFRIAADHHVIEADAILVCAGRLPNLKGLKLKEIGVPMESGVPEFDPHTLQIGGFPIFIAGDANADRAIQHEAADEGRIAVQHALGVAHPLSRRVPLAITFTDPPIVQVGRSYATVEDKRFVVGDVTYRNQGAAVLEQEARGRARLYASKTGVLLGAEMMAPDADHFGHLLALAVQEKLRLHTLLRMPFYHPSLEEALRRALGGMEKKRRRAAA